MTSYKLRLSLLTSYVRVSIDFSVISSFTYIAIFTSLQGLTVTSYHNGYSSMLGIEVGLRDLQLLKLYYSSKQKNVCRKS